MMYMSKFFSTLEAAKHFQKEHGGVLYKNTPRSATRKSYLVEAAMRGLDDETIAANPFVVAWNQA